MTTQNRPILASGDTFDYRGYTFRVRIERDDDMGEPWKEHDDHGIVSDWTQRAKAPGERVLVSDRYSKRYYDVQASTQLARKDGWGCPHGRNIPIAEGRSHYWHGHTSPGNALACAVNADYENLRAWCNDEWCWVYVTVSLLDSDERESVGGIDGYRDGAYCTEVAYELAEEILSRVEVAEPDAVLSVN